MEASETDFTQKDKCAFSSTLISDHYSCSNATNVVRRGGSEISCGIVTASEKCQLAYNNFKKVAIPVFNVSDDLLNMPHGMMVKIQHGGLLGLQLIVNGNTDPVQDISILIQDSEAKFSTLDNIPYKETINYMTAYKVRKRRK